MVYTIADLLNQWQTWGIFDYLLPLLLVFAVVYGILSYIKVFGKNKQVYVVISIVIGLLSLRFNYLGDFLSELAPRLGIGVVVLLSILILVGLFIANDERRYWGWGLGAIAFITAVVIITKSFNTFGWGGMSYYEDYVGWIIGGVLFIGLIIAVAASGGDRTNTQPKGGTAEYKGWGSDT